MLRVFGNQAHEVWDVTRSASARAAHAHRRQPQGHAQELVGVRHRHRLLVGGDPQWRTTRMTQIYDLSDPAKPVFIRNFGLVGQQPGRDRAGADVRARSDLHGPKGNRVYFGYGTSTDGVLQIVDRQKLLTGRRRPTPENLLAPQVARIDLPPMHGRTRCSRCCR
jgi:hypothetical protein